MKPQNRQHPIGQIVCYILLIFLALITVIPFLWMLSASLKLNKDVSDAVLKKTVEKEGSKVL